MTFCIPLSQYNQNPEIYDIVSEPSINCTGCGIDVPTPSGLNVRLDVVPQSGTNVGISIVFSQVLSPGLTTVGEVYVDPDSEDIQIWEVNTTSSFSGDVLILLTVPPQISESQFSKLRVFHKGVDVTFTLGPNAPDYPSRTICGVVQGFSSIKIILALGCSGYPNTTYCKPASSWWEAACVNCDPFPLRDGRPVLDKECNCIPIGACCTGGKECKEWKTEQECLAIHGVWNEGKTCNDAKCCEHQCRTDQVINTINCMSCICKDSDKEICPKTGECVDKCKESENKILNLQSCTCDCKEQCPPGKKFPNDSTCNLAECICDEEICSSQNLALKVEPNPSCECVCDPSTSEECTRLEGTPMEVKGCYKKCRENQRRRVDCECECNPGTTECGGECLNLCPGSSQSLNTDCKCECENVCPTGKKWRNNSPPWEFDNCFCECDPSNSGTYDDCRCQEKIDQNGFFLGACPEGQKYEEYPSCNCIGCPAVQFNGSTVSGYFDGDGRCRYSVTCYQCSECPTGRTRELLRSTVDGKSCSDFTNDTTGKPYVSKCEDCCPQGQKWCVGQDRCETECTGGREFDSDCNCVCPESDEGWCEAQQRCVTNCTQIETAGGKVLDSDCNCVCPESDEGWCEAQQRCVTKCTQTETVGGKVLDEDCNCNCPQGKEWCPTQNRCADSCTQTEKDGGKALDENCNCVCSSFGTFDFEWCEAQQRCVAGCSGGRKFNSICDCVCPQGQEWCIAQEKCATYPCPGDKEWNSFCECACPDDYPLWCENNQGCYEECGNGEVWDDDCNCVCDPNTCLPPYACDPSTGQCLTMQFYCTKYIL